MEPLSSLRSADPEQSILREKPPKAAKDRYWLHALLFLVTFASTIATAGLLYVGRPYRYEHLGDWWFLPDGLLFAGTFLLFLSVHEFGHYFAAKRHGIATSLPYYLPTPFLFVGTMGAVIRIRDPIPTMGKLFDVGASGPLAGFVICLGALLYALFTLPPPTYIMDLPGHEALKWYVEQHGQFPTEMPEAGPGDGEGVLIVGHTLLYWMLSGLFSDVPPMYEMYHYPILFAGWLGLFVTALNLLPVGQLDGGHILYALVGARWHGRLARAFVVVLLVSASVGFVNDLVPALYERSTWLGEFSWFLLAGVLYLFLIRVFDGNHRLVAPALLGIIAIVIAARLTGVAAYIGYWGWFIFVLLIVLFIKVDHPRVLYNEELTPKRRVLAIACLIVFVLCFSIQPFRIA